jgi:hypothetical protein
VTAPSIVGCREVNLELHLTKQIARPMRSIFGRMVPEQLQVTPGSATRAEQLSLIIPNASTNGQTRWGRSKSKRKITSTTLNSEDAACQSGDSVCRGKIGDRLHLVFGDVEEQIAGGEAVLVLEAPLQEPLNLDQLLVGGKNPELGSSARPLPDLPWPESNRNRRLGQRRKFGLRRFQAQLDLE